MAHVKEIAESYDFKKIVSFAQDLIQTKSLSGQERGVVETCIKEGSWLNYDELYFDRMGNFIGKIIVGTGQGKKIVLTGHLDTVNAEPDQWDDITRPFSGAVRQGKLYGRGASDMKGAVATMIHAAPLLKQADGNINGEIYIVGTVVEELFEGVCFLKALRNIKPDYVIVGEATNGKINIAQRGRAEILILQYGHSKHASVGRTTINAIEQVAYTIDVFHRWYKTEAVELLGKRNIVPTDIKIPMGGGGGLDGRGGNSTVPNQVELTYDIRTLPGDTKDSIMDLVNTNLQLVFTNGKTKYPNFKLPMIRYASDECVTFTGRQILQDKFAAAWQTPEDSAIVVKAKAGLQTVDLPVDISAYSFCTDGSAIIRYREEFPNTDCQIIGFGPSEEYLAHTVNEYIEVASMKAAFSGYLGIIEELLRT